MGITLAMLFSQAPCGLFFRYRAFYELIDVKALMGDASDNIPGVAGIGEKAALALVSQFHDLDAVYEHIDDP